MNLFQAARSFVCVAETGSLAKAAERLATSSATISRHVSDLEEALGCRLFQRTTRKLRLTESGMLCLERLTRSLDEIDELTQLIQAENNQPRGTLRISSTTQFWVRKIAPVLSSFLRQHPFLNVQVNVTERCVDLIEEGYDIALQIERPTSNSVVAKPLRYLERILCASPEYLRREGEPRTHADLADHNCLVYAHAAEQVEWKLKDGNGSQYSVEVCGDVRANDTNTLRMVAIAGGGIMLGPLFTLEEELASGRLVRVLPELHSVDPYLWIVYPSRRHLSLKVRRFIDFLDREFGQDYAADPISPPAPFVRKT
ncbi:LysR family transcriptional regulator [Paracandidimonas soli]|uniref:DNA-binding transcriptional LysR family regulator n=1 Tax=Paracandidimonas soli TaxID=1917182 RepID=A0A4R3UYE7_9BURK|nr:LysR family transcriptional regulator [Paracandidimonas soli]TCU96111.1 DNA-binding transcriptional LysR family regulator [Paracandidimonas soli]